MKLWITQDEDNKDAWAIEPHYEGDCWVGREHVIDGLITMPASKHLTRDVQLKPGPEGIAEFELKRVPRAKQ